MRTVMHPCYILHQRPYRESSLLIEIFSRDHGRLGLVAKGARRHGSRRRSLLQPLRPLQLAWSGRGELGTLTHVEHDAPAPALHGRRVLAAFYLNELLMRLLHRYESHPELYEAYDEALRRLEAHGSEHWPLRIFEKRLMESLGYALVLDREVTTGAALAPSTEYFYISDRGPALRAEPGVPNLKVHGAALIALAREDAADPDCLDEARRLMRFVLDGHLGAKPLASRDLYRSFLKQAHAE